MKKVEKDKNKGNKDKCSKTPMKDKRSDSRASSKSTFHTDKIQTYSQIKGHNVNRKIFFFSVVFLCFPLSKPYISI